MYNYFIIYNLTLAHLMRFGMLTLIVNKWSPRIDGLFSFGAPFLAKTSTSPGWVPGGIWRSVIPSTVLTWREHQGEGKALRSMISIKAIEGQNEVALTDARHWFFLSHLLPLFHWGRKINLQADKHIEFRRISSYGRKLQYYHAFVVWGNLKTCEAFIILYLFVSLFKYMYLAPVWSPWIW